MQAQIITIGDEILIGQIVDTNAAYISRALNSAGVVVTERLSIGDDRQRIIEALDMSLAQCDMVI
ncbi:MAG: damage-inducible protein CinA, partial [Rikenellaceae bacterium]|nr:damage-inducible protein CinA [Rikenellaceae bacterium]